MPKLTLVLMAFVLTLGIVLPDGANAAIDPNLIGWWELDEGSGSTAYDSAGSNDGTVTTASWVAGKIGNALDFASGGYVTVPTNAVSTINSQVTVSFWHYGAASLPATNTAFFTYGTNHVMEIDIANNGNAMVLWVASNGWIDQLTKNCTSTSEYKGQWNHWAFTKNTSTGNMKMFLNGAQWQTASGYTRPINASAAVEFKIGSYTGGTNPCLGKLDDVRVFDVELDVNDIKMIMRDADLVGWWEMDEGTGTTINDSAGSNNGTMSGAAWVSGLIGSALDFQNAGTVTVSDNAVSSINQQVTVSMWQYGGASQPVQDCVFFSYGGSGGIIQISIPWNASGNILWLASDGWADQISQNATNSAQYKGQWNNWAFTKNSSTGDMKMYLNGVQWHSGTGKTIPIDGVNATSFCFGSYAGDLYYDGKLDDLRIYNVALDVGTIKAIYDWGLVAEPTTIVCTKAVNPVPANSATNMSKTAGLSWTAGAGARAANGHKVYFGTVASPGANEYKGTQTGTTYDPGTLVAYKTYYWRIDEVNDLGGVLTGDVWNFRTCSTPTDPNLIAFWKFDKGFGTSAADETTHGWTGTLASSPNTPSWTTGHNGSCLNFNDVGTVSASYSALSSINNGVTIAFWQYGNSGEPRTNSCNFFTYGANGGIILASLSWDPAGTAMWLASDGWGDQMYAALSDPATYKGQWNYWAFIKNANTGVMSMYLNAQEFAASTGKYVPIDGANATSLNIGSYISGQYPYDGRMDEVRLYNKALSKEKLQAILDGTEGFASNPEPADNGIGSDPNTVILYWDAGDYAATTNGHDVYLGTVYANVESATTSSALYKGRQTNTYYDPPVLALNTNYYWRIDEVNSAGRPQWKGDVWTFKTCSGVASSTYYVATNGSDNNAGTIGSPFLTIKKARDAIRGACSIPTGGVTVFIRGGNYFLNETIDFTAEDSGTSTKPIVYRAYPGETPRIIGGKLLDPAWFSVTTNAIILARMPAGANGNVYECNLLNHGITSLGQLSSHGESWGHDFNQGVPAPMELLFNGSMMQLACWPNIGTFATIYTGGGEGVSAFTYSGTQPSRWLTASSPFAGGYWYYDFSYQVRSISNINTTSKVISLSPAIDFGTYNNMRWRAYNLLEEIDVAGEYYVESKVGNTFYGMLYFWPTSTLSGKEIVVSLLDTPLFRVNDSQYITFKGLTLELGRYTAVEIDESDYVVVDGCTIKNSGNMGVSVQTGSNCGVKSSEILGTRQAIGLSGGNRFTLEKSYHYARNNKIHDFGRRFSGSYQPGVGLYGVGNEASNNEIYNAPHCGLLFYHNDHLVQYNKIHHVCDEASDIAAMYTHWSWNMRGTDIFYNCVYDLTDNCPTSNLLWGIYIDGFTCEATMFGNIVHNISGYGGIFCQGGRDNDVNNCVITSSNHANCATEAAIGQGCNILGALAPFNYTSPPWSTAYPKLAVIPNDCGVIESYTHPDGCRITRSIGYSNTDWTYAITQSPFAHYTQTNNLTNNDPLYVDAANRFLALQENSPAYGITGFVRIPFEQMGVLDVLKSSNPNPRNATTGIAVTNDLYWGSAFGCTQHTVYLGTAFTDVNTATTSSVVCKSIKQAATSYNPGTMTGGTTYYWRIDETNSADVTTKGTVWNFTTAGGGSGPTFVSAGTVISNASAITPPLPGSIATGDILLLFLETSNQAISISNQNGGTWTQVTNLPQFCGTAAGTTGVRIAAFWSMYNGTQGAPTTSDSGNHQLGRIIAIRGAAASGNPWDVTAGGVEAVSDTSGSIPGATTTVANTLVVTAIATALPDATGTANFGTWTNANLASLTERTDNTVIEGNGGGLGIATGTRASTGAYGNTAVTLGSSAYKAMISIAIKP